MRLRYIKWIDMQFEHHYCNATTWYYDDLKCVFYDIYLQGMSYPSALCNYSFILVFIIRKRQYVNNGNLDSVSCDGFAQVWKVHIKSKDLRKFTWLGQLSFLNSQLIDVLWICHLFLWHFEYEPSIKGKKLWNHNLNHALYLNFYLIISTYFWYVKKELGLEI